ncbi:MAG: hypothetical protein ACOCUS_05960 [Polyangiales bacterium]
MAGDCLPRASGSPGRSERPAEGTPQVWGPAPDPAWGLPAGVWGLFNIAVMWGGIGVARGVGTTEAAKAGAGFIVFALVTTPVVGAGAASPDGVPSSVGALVSGWVFFGLSIASAAALTGVAAAGADLPWAVGLGPLGALTFSNLFFAIAGFNESSRARDAAREGSWALAPTAYAGAGRGLTGAGVRLEASF